MKKPHFFKAKSRIGLLNAPIYTDELNIGVENGPDAILTKAFLKKFPNSMVDEFDFPTPESINKQTYIQDITKPIIQLRDLITQKLQPDEIQIVIGGDHSITFPSMLAVLEKHDATMLGYIQFDSHGDINLYQSSISKNFHGMYVRPLVDRFDITTIDNLVPQKIPTENVMYLGNLTPFLDTEEKTFFEKKQIKNISLETVRKNRSAIEEEFQTFINQFVHIHITFDVDVMDKTIAPATGLPAEKGLLMNDVQPLLKIAAKHPSFSFDLSEINPQKKGAEETIKTAQAILSLMLTN